MVAATGDPERYNQMDERQAIDAYTAARAKLWPGNPYRMQREHEWALARVGAGNGDPIVGQLDTPRAQPVEHDADQIVGQLDKPGSETSEAPRAELVKLPPGSPQEQSQQSQQEQNPWDVGKFIQSFFGAGVQASLASEKGQAEAGLHPETRQVLSYEEQVQQAKEDVILKNPNTSREEADDIIHQRNQRLANLREIAQRNLDEIKNAETNSFHAALRWKFLFCDPVDHGQQMFP